MAGRRHEAFIEDIQRRYPNAKTTGFRKAVAEHYFDDYGIEVGDQLDWLSIIPDAYEVSQGLLIAYEVEDTHRVSDDKMRLYARLWSGLRDMECSEFRLVIMDIRGGRCEPDLARWWYG